VRQRELHEARGAGRGGVHEVQRMQVSAARPEER
jgi:hypothetical protein